jgi:hypothetical protein
VKYTGLSSSCVTAGQNQFQPSDPPAPQGSGGETRTLNLVINSHLLCRLSYPGKLGPRYHPRPPAAAHRELLVTQVIAQLTAAKGLAQLGEAFGLDLAYAFACHAEGLAHFLQGMSLAVLETKA